MIIDRNWAKPSGGGDNTKLKEIVEGTITEITAEDLAGVTKISDSAFRNKDLLEKVALPSSVKNIEQYAFYDCAVLNTVTLNDGLESIGNYAFSRIHYVDIITIPDSVKSIGSSAFDPQGSGTIYKHFGTINISENSQLSSIGDYAFRQCYTKQIYIPDGVKIIPSSCFYNCRYLENVRLSSNLTTIKNHAFGGTAIATIILPDTLTTIERNAFDGCKKLASVTIPANVTSIGNGAFSGCTSLTEMTLLATVPPALGHTSAISTATITIRIPAGTLEAYSTATNWASLASKFVELPAE